MNYNMIQKSCQISQNVALISEATLDCYQRGVKSDEKKQKCLQLLEKVLKDASHDHHINVKS